MIELCCYLDFAQEAVGANGRSQIRSQDLHGDEPVVPWILREVHRGHPAGRTSAREDALSY